jgi:hypothetical protein
MGQRFADEMDAESRGKAAGILIPENIVADVESPSRLSSWAIPDDTRFFSFVSITAPNHSEACAMIRI